MNDDAVNSLMEQNLLVGCCAQSPKTAHIEVTVAQEDRAQSAEIATVIQRYLQTNWLVFNCWKHRF